MSTAPKLATITKELETICGAEHVRVDEASLRARSIDGVIPQAVVSPGTPEQTAAVLKFAASKDLVVAPAGNHSRQHIGCVPSRVDLVVETTRMNSIQYFEPGDLTIGIEAGANLRDVVAHIEAHGQTLPLDPPSASCATIGGIVATGASGPLRHSYGNVRDFCLGVTFATVDGKVAKAGGRVVKNVAGYDVTKLLVGSYGTLAIVTSANFRVFPRVQQTRTFVAEFRSYDDALHARDQLVLGSPLTPMGLELVCPEASRAVMPHLHNRAWRLLLRAGGSDSVLARYSREVGSLVSLEIDGDAETRLWTAVADFVDGQFARNPNTMTLRIALPQQRLGRVLAAAEQAAQANGFTAACAGRATTPLSLAFIPSDGGDYAAVLRAVRTAVGNDGAVVVTHCPVQVKRALDVWGTTQTDGEAMKTVKKTFDERNILNRGRFLL
jgi:glycolate oxidase FAD binding subunit